MGHKNVHIFNGGWKAWAGSGSAVETSINTPVPSVYAGKVAPSLRVTRQYVQNALSNRSAKLIELKSNNAAMIAGGLQYDCNALFDSDATFRDHNQLEEVYKKLGVTGETETIIHVTDDSRSSYSYFTLRLLGYPSVKIYCDS